MASRTRTPKAPPATAGGALPLLTDGARLLAHDDVQYDSVPVPEWGGTIRVRTLSVEEVRQWVEDLKRPELQATSGPRLVALCAVDAAGRQLFTPSDVEALGRKNARAMTRVFRAANRLNKLLVLPDDDPVGDAKND